MKFIKTCLLTFFALFIAINAQAKVSKVILREVKQLYTPAEQHAALQFAYENLDPAKLRAYVVVMKEGIAAEKPHFFINWEDYDYRVTVLKNNRLKTRRGKAYAYLKPGDVMAVVDVEAFGSTVYLKLLSPDTYKPAGVADSDPIARVSAKFGVKFRGGATKGSDPAQVLKGLREWLMPFHDKGRALEYAWKVRGEKPGINQAPPKTQPVYIAPIESKPARVSPEINYESTDDEYRDLPEFRPKNIEKPQLNQVQQDELESLPGKSEALPESKSGFGAPKKTNPGAMNNDAAYPTVDDEYRDLPEYRPKKSDD